MFFILRSVCTKKAQNASNRQYYIITPFGVLILKHIPLPVDHVCLKCAFAVNEVLARRRRYAEHRYDLFYVHSQLCPPYKHSLVTLFDQTRS